MHPVATDELGNREKSRTRGTSGNGDTHGMDEQGSSYAARLGHRAKRRLSGPGIEVRQLSKYRRDRFQVRRHSVVRQHVLLEGGLIDIHFVAEKKPAE
jgi:hypothetical protein